MNFERMLNREHIPGRDDIVGCLGKDAVEAWDDTVSFIEDNYNFTPETVFGGKKYGWAIRYRKSGKSLCTLYPENGAFTIQIVLGGKEAEQVIARLSEFRPSVAGLISGTEQLRDGRWLWIRVLNKDDTDDIKRLLQIKKKTQKRIE
jgi:hypothetical protein